MKKGIQGPSRCGNNRDRALRKPSWLKRSIPAGAGHRAIRRLLDAGDLHTVCQEALCPNLGECFSRRTATFLILGNRCTRNCRFCAVEHGPPGPPDPGEPAKVAEAVENLGLSYAVITSVTRDDLPDGGAGVFADTVREIRRLGRAVLVELLIPDFQGNAVALHAVLESRPDVLNHNIETVPRLYDSVRPGARYRRSLQVLQHVKDFDPAILTKSGLMLGLGETAEEIWQTLRDLVAAGCDILTLGQYLQPTKEHLPVERFVEPEEFEAWRATALDMGFGQVASGPLVRSSYRARELCDTALAPSAAGIQRRSY